MGLNDVKVTLTKDLVLERVSPLDIFEAFMPCKFDLNTPINSPLRRDRNPSFVVRFKGGHVFFVDYATGERGDAFDFVAKLHNLHSFPEILEAVDSHMGLNLKNSKPKLNKVYEKKKIDIDDVEEEKLIQVKIKRFTQEELDWWATYGLDISDLKKQTDVKVYSVKNYWVNKELKFNNLGHTLCFAYHFEKVDKWKIYYPLADKSKGEVKWISNVPLQIMYGLDNIVNCDKAIITKSFKDLAVLNKIYPCVCATQNESLAAISDDNLAFIKGNSKEAYFSADSDEAGKKASWEITKKLGLQHLNIPDYLLTFGCKDWSDWCKRDGSEAIKYFLKLKGF